jgi:hypothetical protein
MIDNTYIRPPRLQHYTFIYFMSNKAISNARPGGLLKLVMAVKYLLERAEKLKESDPKVGFTSLAS